MAIVTRGIDLAQNVFTVHGVDAARMPVLLHPAWRVQSRQNSLPPCRRAGLKWKPAQKRKSPGCCWQHRGTIGVRWIAGHARNDSLVVRRAAPRTWPVARRAIRQSPGAG